MYNGQWSPCNTIHQPLFSVLGISDYWMQQCKRICTPEKEIIYVSAVWLVGTGEVGPITCWPPRFILKSCFSNYLSGCRYMYCCIKLSKYSSVRGRKGWWIRLLACRNALLPAAPLIIIELKIEIFSLFLSYCLSSFCMSACLLVYRTACLSACHVS